MGVEQKVRETWNMGPPQRSHFGARIIDPISINYQVNFKFRDTP